MMTSQTEVGIITGNPPTMMGGVERFTLTIVQQLRERGILTRVYDNSLITPWESKWYDKLGLSGPRCDKAVGKKAREKMKDNPVEAIIQNGNSGWSIKRNMHVPRIVVHHGTWRGVAPNLLRKGASLKAKLANKVLISGVQGNIEKYTSNGAISVAVSGSVARELTDYYNTESVIIPNGIDIEHFYQRDKYASKKKYGFDSNDKVICYTGRVEYNKGSDVIQKIADYALKTDYKIKFLIATDKTPKDWPANVVFVNNIGYNEMPYIYSAGDIFLFPSRYEGCSYSILEAMACRVPVVISSTGYGLDIKKDNILSEFVVDNLAPELYWEKLLKLCDNNWNCKVGNAGLDFIRKHNTINKMIDKYIDLINRVIWERSKLGGEVET